MVSVDFSLEEDSITLIEADEWQRLRQQKRDLAAASEIRSAELHPASTGSRRR